MTSQNEKLEGRVLFKTELKIKKWHNCSNSHDQPLINPIYLKEIEQVLKDAEGIYNELTIPGYPENYRIEAGGFWHRPGQIGNKKNELRLAISKLTGRWEEAKGEAKKRLKEVYRESDYPDKKSLNSLYSIDFKIDYENYLSTLDILGKYSIFHREPTIFDAIEDIKKIKEEMKKPPGERKLPE